MNKSKAPQSAKSKTFKCYLQFFNVIANLGMDIYIYNMQAFKTTWVNSPAYQNHTEVVSWLAKF